MKSWQCKKFTVRNKDRHTFGCQTKFDLKTSSLGLFNLTNELKLCLQYKLIYCDG